MTWIFKSTKKRWEMRLGHRERYEENRNGGFAPDEPAVCSLGIDKQIHTFPVIWTLETL